MGMVVRTNTMGINANRQLGMNTLQVSKSLEKLASGYRINRAGDDAAGLAISESMKLKIKQHDTAVMNAQDGISYIQTAEGALTEVHDMLNRMVELVGRANLTQVMKTSQISLVNAEMRALCTEINRIVDETEFNGKKVLTSGEITSVSFDLAGLGQVSKASILGSDTDFATLKINGDGSGLLSVASDNAFSALAASTMSVNQLNSAVFKISLVRANLGAVQNRLEHTVNNLELSSENLTAANSRIRDTDMAKMMMNYTQTNVVTQAAQAMLAQANQQPQAVLQLLQ